MSLEDVTREDDVSSINPELKADDKSPAEPSAAEATEAGPKSAGFDLLEYELPSQGDDDEVVGERTQPV